jgi:hypothetical protein
VFTQKLLELHCEFREYIGELHRFAPESGS